VDGGVFNFIQRKIISDAMFERGLLRVCPGKIQIRQRLSFQAYEGQRAPSGCRGCHHRVRDALARLPIARPENENLCSSNDSIL
jgi:hypothetical protein